MSVNRALALKTEINECNRDFTTVVSYGMIPRMRLLVRAILWLKQTELGLSFLLGVASWCVLVAIDMHLQQGGLVDTAIWRVLGPVYRAGCYVGAIVFADSSAHGTSLKVVSLGAATEILVLMALWFVGIRVARRMRAERQSEKLQQP
jgi:hypothetical protein